MGDFNLDLSLNTNRKLVNLIERFDWSQLISQPTRVTETSSTDITFIHHILKIFLNALCHIILLVTTFLYAFSRKLNNKTNKSDHITTSYLSFKTSNEDTFINDLSGDLNNFTVCPQSHIKDDLMIWYSIFLKHLDQQVPYKTKCVKFKNITRLV